MGTRPQCTAGSNSTHKKPPHLLPCAGAALPTTCSPGASHKTTPQRLRRERLQFPPHGGSYLNIMPVMCTLRPAAALMQACQRLAHNSIMLSSRQFSPREGQWQQTQKPTLHCPCVVPCNSPASCLAIHETPRFSQQCGKGGQLF